MNNEAQDRQVQDLQKVLEISRAMVATEDLDRLLGLIVERGMELLDAERATVYLYDAATDELVSRIAAEADEIRMPADAGIAGAAAVSGQVINVPDAYADARFNPEVDRRTGFKTHNILAIPLRDYEGGLVGVLQVLNKRLGTFGEYDISLARTLAAQAGVVVQRANLIEHYLRKQEMERAMKIAQDIQRGLLPAAPPKIDGFEVAGFSQPADETGGDTYDFMELTDGKWMFAVADATGHGIGPALVIAETRAMLRAICLQGTAVPRALETVNNFLAEDLEGGRFVTCFLGILDPSDRRLTYASAGHGPMLFYDRKADSFRTAGATSIPLGIMSETDYAEVGAYCFNSGDFLAIITDGFVEAADAKGEEFGVERLTRLFRMARDAPADVMIEAAYTAVCEFAAGQPQADDLTAVIVRKL